MRRIKLVLLCFSLMYIFNLHAQKTASRVVGYIPTWGDMSNIISQTDFNGFSHVMLAFANPDMDGNIGFQSLGGATIQSLITKAHNSGCQVLISIGGGSADINAAWINNLKPANHATLLQNLMNLMNQYNFDGIDVDLEGDLVLSSNYAGFITDLDEILPQSKLLTAAMATWSASNLSKTTLSHYDFIGVMSYDQTGPWTPNSPGQHSSYGYAVSDINYWTTTKGLPADKVVLGVPFYGYNFVSTSNIYSMTYAEIVGQNEGAESLDQVDNIFYNGIPTIKSKTELAVKSAGGVMIWEITQDVAYSDDRSLLKAIHSVIEPVHSEILSLTVSIETITCYPVPTSDYLILDQIDHISPVSILTLDGREIWTGQTSSHKKIDVSHLNNGSYLLVYKNKGMKALSKFIKI